MSTSHKSDIITPNICQGNDKLYILYDIITPDVEEQLIKYLNNQTWSTVSSSSNSRRVIHFGRSYNYKSRKDDGPSGVSPIPPEIKHIADHLIKYGIMPRVEQVIINEYLPGQNISAHSDIPAYGDVIVSLGIGESANFIFRGISKNKGQVMKIVHPSRSLLVFGGIYRHDFTHEIPGRKTIDMPDGSRVKKHATRISLTMRYMQTK